jgi:hypothetical protein
MRRDAVSITDDVQRRSAHIHWPGDVNPDRADLFAHNDIVVNAPADVIWSHLVRASAWPSWYSNASDVVVNAPNGMLGPRLPVLSCDAPGPLKGWPWGCSAGQVCGLPTGRRISTARARPRYQGRCS